MFADYDISLGQADAIPGILVLQEMNLAERGGGLSVRQTGDWFRHAMHEKSLVVGRQKNKVVGYVLGTSLAANTHVTIIQTMLRAFPPPPDCYLYSTTLCKARWRHGNADTTVIPSNARETIKQWTDVHGLSNAPSNQVTIEGYPRQVWLNGAGEEIVESYTITHMAHGTPLATGDADFECGAAGPFLLEVGISSSFHIAKFFGLTLNSARPMTSELPNHPAVSLRTPLAQPEFFYGKILDDATTEQIRPKSPRSRIDIGAVITRALESAGLRPRG